MQSHNNHIINTTQGNGHESPAVLHRAEGDQAVAELEAGGDAVPTTYAPSTGRRLLVLVFVVAVILAVAFLVVHHRSVTHEQTLKDEAEAAASSAADVDVVRVSYAPKTQSLTLPGTARAWYETTLYARVNGYVGMWYRDIGDKVKKDEVLARIETPELDDQLNAARAKVAADNSEVEVAKANAAFALSTYQRWKDSAKGVVSEQEREEKKAEHLSADAHLVAAQSQVQLDEAEVKRLADMSSFKEVRAPYEGVVTARRIDIGDLVTAGSTASTTPLYDIAKSDKIRVFVDVPQAASVDIRDGMKAVVTSNEFPGKSFTGTVARNSKAIDLGSKTLRVEVDLDNADMVLKPGMYMEVHFDTTSETPLVRVPASAMTFRSHGPQLAIVRPDGTIQFHDVAIGRDLGNYVDLSSGVEPGQEVALNISNQVGDGDKVVPKLVSDSEGPPAAAPKQPATAGDESHRPSPPAAGQERQPAQPPTPTDVAAAPAASSKPAPADEAVVH